MSTKFLEMFKAHGGETCIVTVDSGLMFTRTHQEMLVYYTEISYPYTNPFRSRRWTHESFAEALKQAKDYVYAYKDREP